MLDPQIAWYRFHYSLFNALQHDPRYHWPRLEDIQAQPQSSLRDLGGIGIGNKQLPSATN